VSVTPGAYFLHLFLGQFGSRIQLTGAWSCATTTFAGRIRHVCFLIAKKEMLWINALRVVAAMADEKTFGNGAVQ
jgi:hypothetical protein